MVRVVVLSLIFNVFCFMPLAIVHKLYKPMIHTPYLLIQSSCAFSSYRTQAVKLFLPIFEFDDSGFWKLDNDENEVGRFIIHFPDTT